ncbi:Natural resistance-associated macrophage protein [Pirellulimonas nuda]|uniref:Natural resistance-associated macrophage protein n=1 Tax=Pirellulimonas nuda TaxID=2528009 RepID=A0A518DIQ1_9BACT|nr:divalent metal cation transporter [Pirellulimonas nuda]QDU91357.1 Natural resistance-associated macrophage protein [Pirellulimonas nuda]
MVQPDNRLARDRAALDAVADRGPAAKAVTYLRLSGPGWLQSAITLGGGSLAGGLYLGVLCGYSMMWLQPLAMMLGVAMLSAIAYVTLSTGRRPFRLVVEEVNPVLGWGWAIATIMANIVWCLPQFTLGAAALRQNLLPGVLGDEATGTLGGNTGLVVAVALLATCALATIASYERGGRGMAIFESVLKLLVGVIVLCFVGVVWKLTGVAGGIDWSAVFSGLIPRLSSVTEPSPAFREPLAAAGDLGSRFWQGLIVGDQRDVMFTAAATAVGVNMTFLLPNSLLDRGWDRRFRGLSIVDLGVGLFIPFMIATSCVVMSSAARFHGQYNEALVAAEPSIEATREAAGAAPAKEYLGLLDKRLGAEYGEDASGWSDQERQAKRAALPAADRQLAAMLVRRDASDLAAALEPLVGKSVSQLVFGCGVLAMALSTIVVLMLINGYAVCEVLGQPHRGMVHFLGSLAPLVFGVVVPFFWKDAMFWLAVPTSVFGIMLIPIAYFVFVFLINSRRVLGDAALTGGWRTAVNAVLIPGAAIAAGAAGWSIWTRTQPFPGTGIETRWIAIAASATFIALALLVRRKALSRPT